MTVLCGLIEIVQWRLGDGGRWSRLVCVIVVYLVVHVSVSFC